MGVSFLSALPSFLANVPPPSAAISAAKCPGYAGTVRCCKYEDNCCRDEGRFRQRDILNGVARVGAIASVGTFVDNASVADLIQRRQRSEFLCKFLKHLTMG
ncbi:hypothetical protein Ancab_036445 [Ancistrocladus abbreviatus]